MNVKRQIFEFIIDHQTRWNTAPTQSEIRDAFVGISSNVDLHLRQLTQEGLIAIDADEDAPIALTPAFDLPTKINFRGKQATGGSMMLNLRGLDFPLPAHDMEAMQVNDESMTDAGIENGDIVILACATPTRGDIVAVSLDGIDTLRRYLMISGIPHLLAENSRRPDLCAAFDIPMHGVMWGMIRMESCRLRPNIVQNKFSYSALAEGRQGDESLQRLDVRSVVTPSSDSVALPRAQTARKGQHRVLKQKIKIDRPTKKTSPPDWPKPPSGIMLNDSQRKDYRAPEDPAC